jgi:hypothetical protein
MNDGDGDAELIADSFLEEVFPRSRAGGVAPTVVSKEEQMLRFRVFPPTYTAPPFGERGDGKLRGIV